MSFTLSTSNLTDTSTSIVMTLTSDYSTSQSVSMSVQEGGSSGSTIYSTTVTIPAGATTGNKIRTPISSLTASTTYYVATTISGGVVAADLTFTTRDTGYDTVPKVATQGQWEDLANRVKAATTFSVLDCYPVGSYYETSDTSFDPNVSWGGTWVEDTAGRVLVAVNTGTFSTVGDTGGEETHTLTIAEMPSHNHQLIPQSDNGGSSSGHTTYWGAHKTARQYTLNTGGGGAHNNLQPYIVIKRWHRTA